MGAKIVRLPRSADPNIRRVLEEFLEEQRKRLAPRTLARYEAVLDLLRSHLNGYAHECLSAPEAARFERSYNAEGAPRGRLPKVTRRVGESPPQYVDWDEEA